jgi:hypothetical protein
MITVNSNSVQDINAALLSMKQQILSTKTVDLSGVKDLQNSLKKIKKDIDDQDYNTRITDLEEDVSNLTTSFNNYASTGHNNYDEVSHIIGTFYTHEIGTKNLYERTISFDMQQVSSGITYQLRTPLDISGTIFRVVTLEGTMCTSTGTCYTSHDIDLWYDITNSTFYITAPNVSGGGRPVWSNPVNATVIITYRFLLD